MIELLNFWRVVFISMIFVFHMGVFPYGYCGVTFFFILSGFVMSFGYGEKVQAESFSYKSFMKKRLQKVYPLHLLCLIWSLLLGKSITIALLPNILLIQSWFPFTKIYFSYNGVSWFLSNVVFFYALFPYLYRKIQSKPKSGVSVLGIVLLLYFILVQLIPSDRHHFYFYINPLFRLIDFVLGMFLFRLYSTIREKNIRVRFASCKFLLSVLLFGLFIYFHSRLQAPEADFNVYSYAALYWIPSCVLIFYSVCMKNVSIGFFKSLVRYSFSFYMIHQLFILTSDKILNSYDVRISRVILLLLLFPLCYYIAYLMNVHLEKPMVNWLKNYKK